MSGASLTFLKLDDELKRYLYETCHTPSFKQERMEEREYSKCILQSVSNEENFSVEEIRDFTIYDEKMTFKNVKSLIFEMADFIISNERRYCELDAFAGDGDFGASIASGFRQLIHEKGRMYSTDTLFEFFNEISLILMEKCGGASGPIWGAAFRGMANSSKGKDELNAQDVTILLEAAIESIQKVGQRAFGRGATVGDKTLMDALIPCFESWRRESNIILVEKFLRGAQAACEGAERTKGIVARMGRAGTVGERSLGYPDAGAFALGEIFTHLSNILKKENY